MDDSARGGVCGYCGLTSDEPLNCYGVHDYCVYDPERTVTDDAHSTTYR